MAARGIRNNNPGNIEYGPFARQWGATGREGKGRFAVFPSPEAGIAAIIGLQQKYENSGRDTIRERINRWAPVSAENPQRVVDNYIQMVSASMGIDPDTPFSINDPVLGPKFVSGMIQKENGYQPYTEEQLVAGHAMGAVAPTPAASEASAIANMGAGVPVSGSVPQIAEPPTWTGANIPYGELAQALANPGAAAPKQMAAAEPVNVVKASFGGPRPAAPAMPAIPALSGSATAGQHIGASAEGRLDIPSQVPLPTPRPTPPAAAAASPASVASIDRPAPVKTGNALGDRMLNAILSQNPLELSAIGNDYAKGNPVTFGKPGFQMANGLAAVTAVKGYLDAHPDVASQVKGILEGPMTSEARKGLTQIAGELPGKATPPQMPLATATPNFMPTPRPEHIAEPKTLPTTGVSAWGRTTQPSDITPFSSGGGDFLSGAKPSAPSMSGSASAFGGSQPISVSYRPTAPYAKTDVPEATPISLATPIPAAPAAPAPTTLASALASGAGFGAGPPSGTPYAVPGAKSVPAKITAPAGVKVASPAPKAAPITYKGGPMAGAPVPRTGGGINAFSIPSAIMSAMTAARNAGYTTGIASPGYTSTPGYQDAMAHGYTAPNFSQGSGGAIYAYQPNGQGGGTYVNSFGQTMTY